MSTSSNWWYGVAPFPLVPLASWVGRWSSRLFIRISTAGGDPNVLAGVAAFATAVLSFWVGVIVALVVLVCLAADVRALRKRGAWSPSRAWVAVGVVHLVGAEHWWLLSVSMPTLAYYQYRRHERVGSP